MSLKFLDKFEIQFSNLIVGNYHFEFEINETFFKCFDESEIQQSSIFVEIELKKELRMLVMDFNLKGNVNLVCDRCLDDFDCFISSSNRLVVKIGNEKKEISDEMLMLPEAEHTLNVAQFIYEYAHLALPVKRMHPEDENGFLQCNSEVIKKLKEHEVKEQNDNDSRWDNLKKLNLN